MTVFGKFEKSLNLHVPTDNKNVTCYTSRVEKLH